MGKMETQSKSSVIKWFSPLLTTAILLLIFHATEAKDCQLVGPGACRGLKWSEGTWPQLVQDRTIDECCTLCKSTRSCTAFSVGKGTKPKKPCFLYNHKDIQPASGLGGECYKIIAVDTDEGEKPKKIVKETEKKAKKPKVEKVEKKEKVEEKPVEKAKPKLDKPAEKPEAKVEKPVKEPVKKAEKLDKPAEKPDKPVEKPAKVQEKAEKKPKEKLQKPE